MAPPSQPTRLAPPGAGLPFIELRVARLLFTLRRRLCSRGQLSGHFGAECERILSLARCVGPAEAAAPVLIRRVVGIEDSSRNWSVYMTVAHLVSVNDWIVDIAERLAAGEPGGREVSVAAVKPDPAQDPIVVDRFAHCARDYVARVDALPSLRTELRHAHPWFGPLDAHGWHCLAAIHSTIHRRQIERILRGLPRR